MTIVFVVAMFMSLILAGAAASDGDAAWGGIFLGAAYLWAIFALVARTLSRVVHTEPAQAGDTEKDVPSGASIEGKP